MSRIHGPSLATRLSALQGILPIDRAILPGEFIAGLTLAAIAIPEVVGYSSIAGMPPITGLYTLLVPMLLFAVLGSSRHLVVGADSATAAMLAAALGGMAVSSPQEYVALAGALALLTGVFLLLARVLRLGFLADFLSRTVLVGFLAGVGVQVSVGQIPTMLGLAPVQGGVVAQLVGIANHIGQVDALSAGLSAGVIALIVVARRASPSIPGPLIAIVGAIIGSRALDLGAGELALVGPLPSGLPAIAMPALDWSWPLVEKLLPTAFGMFVVVVAQSAATARAYADRRDESFNVDIDLVGLGLANLGACLSGTFVVNGSPTKTQIVAGAGGQSQLAQLCTAGTVLLVLLFFTGPLAWLPQAALAAVVFLIGVELVDLRQLRRVFAERRAEFGVALTTVVVVVFWSVEQGILLAIFLSLVSHTRHGYRPHNVVLVQGPSGRLRPVSISAPAQLVSGLMVYRFTHSMYYANAGRLSNEVLGLVREASPPLRCFCIDCGAVDDLDFSAAQTLRSLHGQLAEHGVRLLLATVSPEVQSELDRSGLTDLLEDGAIFATIDDVTDALGA